MGICTGKREGLVELRLLVVPTLSGASVMLAPDNFISRETIISPRRIPWIVGDAEEVQFVASQGLS